ncbi:MAG: hypothetical protein MK089_10985, partial [Phycisphaerales bacterium]|nr:hypothetical protein [Phycisphaerales bacterium]
DATNSSDGFNDDQCGGTYLGQMYGDVWFSYVATCTGTLTVSTCNIVNFDTDLVVYQGGCGDLNQISCNGDGNGCADFTSYLQVSVVAGQDYLIRVGGWENGNVGNGSLSIECE